MTYDLTNKVAVVTGGNSGIGLGIAQELAEQGAKPTGDFVALFWALISTVRPRAAK